MSDQPVDDPVEQLLSQVEAQLDWLEHALNVLPSSGGQYAHLAEKRNGLKAAAAAVREHRKNNVSFLGKPVELHKFPDRKHSALELLAIKDAHEEHGDDEHEIDETTAVSDNEDRGFWVMGWYFTYYSREMKSQFHLQDAEAEGYGMLTAEQLDELFDVADSLSPKFNKDDLHPSVSKALAVIRKPWRKHLTFDPRTGIVYPRRFRGHLYYQEGPHGPKKHCASFDQEAGSRKEVEDQVLEASREKIPAAAQTIFECEEVDWEESSPQKARSKKGG